MPKIFSRFLNYGLTAPWFPVIRCCHHKRSDTSIRGHTFPQRHLYIRTRNELSSGSHKPKTGSTLQHSEPFDHCFHYCTHRCPLHLQKPATNSWSSTIIRQYVTWMIWIIFFDTLIVIPQSQLRLEERPARYALSKHGIHIHQHRDSFFFLLLRRTLTKQIRKPYLAPLYDPQIGVGYFILGNLVASICSLLFLYPEIRQSEVRV